MGFVFRWLLRGNLIAGPDKPAIDGGLGGELGLVVPAGIGVQVFSVQHGQHRVNIHLAVQIDVRVGGVIEPLVGLDKLLIGQFRDVGGMPAGLKPVGVVRE